MPSAAQKRPKAKGRSFDTHTIATLGTLAASVWNLRTEVAHTPVSTLGKIFRSTFLPLKSAKATSFNSLVTQVKLAAVEPTSGRLPAVCAGCS